jgi:hypothetical protein
MIDDPMLKERDVSEAFSGGCLCGAIRYTCDGDPMMAGHCHCEDCRRTSGSGHSSHLMVPAGSVAMTGEVKGYVRPSDSGNAVTRAFCPTCGAPVFSTNAAIPGMLFLRASSLDDLEVFQPQMHVYAMRAASWDKPGAGVATFDKLPPGM